MSYILAFDPGGTTGWALGEFSDTDPLIFHGGGQLIDGVEGFVEFMFDIHEVTQELIIVSESFQLRPSVRNPDVTPLRIEGALTAILGPGVVQYQQPALKATVGDSKLKEHGFWIPGQRHQMDARIHALAYLKKAKHMPTLQAYWKEKD